MIDSGKGFTLIELIAVLLVIGILAAFAVPSLNLASYREQGFIQQSLATIRYAQKQAISSGCNVEVDITAVGCNLNWTGDPVGSTCPMAALSNPVNGNANFCEDSNAPAGSTFPASPFTFDKIGTPSAGTVQYILGATTIQVEAETGYARRL